MPTLKGVRNYLRLFLILLALFFSVYCFYGCGGGGGAAGTGDQGKNEEPDPNEQLPDGPWEQFAIARIEAGGLLSPRVRAAMDSRGRVHVVYFYDDGGAYRLNSGTYALNGSRALNSDINYRINYDVLDGQDFHHLLDPEQEQAAGDIDNCAVLAFALTPDDCPVVAYRGGEIRECGTEQQSDVMLGIRENNGDNTWNAYTGAIGVVERNPVFGNGLAGTEASVVTDSQGNIHLCYQFFYEGCDSMNYNYPDLCYVKKDRSDLEAAAVEETVEGNNYDGDNLQNTVGAHCVITLDSDENPVIFYYAESVDNSRGLRVARKQNGVWEKEWVEQGCEVGFISCARRDADGYIGVAYYVKGYLPGYPESEIHCLRYAGKQYAGVSSSSAWQVHLVDSQTWCGDYCSLAFDSSGFAAIAYYEMQSHSGYFLKNLKLAHFNGSYWAREVVSSTGDIGLYNNLWLDDHNHPVICSYSNTDQTVYLFYGNLPL